MRAQGLPGILRDKCMHKAGAIQFDLLVTSYMFSLSSHLHRSQTVNNSGFVSCMHWLVVYGLILVYLFILPCLFDHSGYLRVFIRFIWLVYFQVLSLSQSIGPLYARFFVHGLN